MTGALTGLAAGSPGDSLPLPFSLLPTHPPNHLASIPPPHLAPPHTFSLTRAFPLCALLVWILPSYTLLLCLALFLLPLPLPPPAIHQLPSLCATGRIQLGLTVVTRGIGLGSFLGAALSAASFTAEGRSVSSIYEYMCLRSCRSVKGRRRRRRKKKRRRRGSVFVNWSPRRIRPARIRCNT